MISEDALLPNDPDEAHSLRLTIRREDAGLRLDHFLVLRLPELSRSQLSQAVRDGEILLNGEKTKAGRKLQEGDIIAGRILPAAGFSVIPQKIPFIVLYEDEHLLLLSKPPHLVVHPANGNPDNTLVNGLLYHCGAIGEVGDPVRPGLVHRLDKDTSGVMVAAKNNDIHRRLVEIFKSRQVMKKYHALVLGVPREQEGRIVAAIGRHPVQRQKMAVREDAGRFAATTWTVKRVYLGAYSLVELVIETGRTHQIRVHMAHMGHPVAGDTVYGPARQDPLFARQMLHSSELSFLHPVSGRRISGIAPLWPDFADVLNVLEQREEER